MLSCKDVAIQASDYLEHNTSQSLRWKIRVHLMLCTQCRRFIRHLRITRILVSNTAIASAAMRENEIDPMAVYERLLKRVKNSSTPQ